MYTSDKATCDELAESIRKLTYLLDSQWTLDDPQAYMCEAIEWIGRSENLAGKLPHIKAAVQAGHVLRRARIAIGRDRDVNWCETPEEAMRLAQERMAAAYAKCGKELEELASELIADDDQEGTADTKTDTPKKNLSLPTSAEVHQLCVCLKRELKQVGVKQIDVALENTNGDRQKAKNLLRQARRYRHLWDASYSNGQADT